MDELLQEFLTESAENIGELDIELVKLEQTPDDPEMLASIFRLVHTVKGTCGFLGLPRLEALAHAAENVLGKLRDGELEVTPEAVTLILESFDGIKEIMAGLEATEAEPEGDDSGLIERLNALAAEDMGSSEEKSVEPEAAREASDEAPLDELEAAFQAAKGPDELAAEEEKPAKAGGKAAETGRAQGPAGEPSIANQSIRVNVELLEGLMNLVSELVLSRNQLLQMVRGHSDSEFAVPLQRLSHVTTDLQEGVMKTRMQPIGNAWAKLPRLVRDLSLDLGKKIELEMLGADTELDRQVLELIKDPLTHMVRNSADHGLETPQARRQTGKPETGKIVLNAFHEGGHIVIEITDDGRGISTDKVRAKALSQGLATESDLEDMSDQQILQFIFKPGFSTASNVTNVSGRGVGLDVVRTNIEKIGGTVELKSEAGQGSAFTIKIPLTLAIVSALVVAAAGERFAIPQIAVSSLVRVSGASEHKIETINETPVLRQRDRLLPLVSLSSVLRLGDDAGRGAADGWDGFVVVTQVGNYSFGIVVDKVFDTEEIVVKPVAPILRHIGIFSGNTILGDGSVIMILDPNGMAAATGEVSVADAGMVEETKRDGKGDDVTALLVFTAGGAEPKAVPLSLVARLEEIDRSAIETSNARLVVQYRGQLMPLVKMDGFKELKSEGRQPILVFTEDNRSMGLLVDEIVDIVEEQLEIELASERPGRLGSAVVGGKATEIIDIGYYLMQAFGDWFDKNERTVAGEKRRGKRVLLVDDSPFFRNLLKPLLASAGYSVTTAEGADVALEMRAEGEEFDVILSDIEMPGMNGFEFVEALKQGPRWQNTPVVALSSHTTPEDLDRGREAGFYDHVAKSDRDGLLHALSQTLSTSTSGGAA